MNKGQGYLKIDDNIFFYDPESRKFSKYTGANNFQDSNAKNSDFQNSTLAGDYQLIDSGREKLGAKDTWVLTLKAKRNDVTYPKRKIWVEVSSVLLLKSEDYSLSDRLMRTSLYGKYLQIQDRFVPQLMRFDDNLKKGEVTVITLENPSLSKLPDAVFTPSVPRKGQQLKTDLGIGFPHGGAKTRRKKENRPSLFRGSAVRMRGPLFFVGDKQ